MKQQRLTFPSSIRTASATRAKKVVDTVKSSPAPSHDPLVGTEETTRKLITTLDSSATHTESSLEDQSQSDLWPARNIKDPRWRKLVIEAKAKRGGLPLGLSSHIVLCSQSIDLLLTSKY